MKLPLRIGIIGYGKVGKVRKAVVDGDRRLKLAAVCDPAADPALEGVFFTRDYRELLAREVDAVFVCTPNNVTADIVVAALNAGKHVLCEKPPGRDLEDVRRILDAERRRPELKLKFGFNHRYHEVVSEATALLRSKRLGEVLWMRGVYGKSGGEGFREQWRSDRRIAGGGILLDQGIHMVDLLRHFGGDFTDVKSFVGNRYWDLDVEDNAFALLRGRSGIVASLHSSSTHWRHQFLLEIFTSEGYLTLNGILSGTRSYGRETLTIGRRSVLPESIPLGSLREEVRYFDDDPSWRKEVEEFAVCVIEDKPLEVGTSADALAAMELIDRIYREDATWHKRLVGSRPAAGAREGTPS